jgi:cytochrome c peroxidase
VPVDRARPPSLLMLWLLLAGAPAGAGPATGLDRPFPPAAGEAPTPERVALGRLLFFDPVLSRDGDLSCAHCHHPERAFSDGRPRARGRGGVELRRNTPTLYNAGFRTRLFWDGRAPDLESQALSPLLAPDEMAADPDALLARLRAIPEYRARFASAFPAEGPDAAISLATVARALAAFERTLVSRGSRYDRYAAGDREALGPPERRGLALLRSLHTRCFECHPPPLFAAPLATGVGVPGGDDGVGAAAGTPGQRGFFRVPSLRNAARTAPYMHDGSLATLEDVVRFYARGGGRALGVDAARIDDQVRAFALRDEEVADLVAFLGALTDESARPEIPASVPSGLPPVAPLAETVPLEVPTE